MTDPRRITPYVGLAPYSEGDADFFFGRERERQVIAGNLLAARLTTVFGPSGVGKSSVLRAGVARDLRKLAHRDLELTGHPEFAVVVFDGWRDDPVAGIAERCAEELALAAAVAPPTRVSDATMTTLTRRRLDTRPRWPFPPSAAGSDIDLLIILDQFEEYFLYHAGEDGEGTLAVELPRAIEDPELSANFIVSLREDALARLDVFKGRISDIFGNYLRIDHLSRAAAEEAIRGPIRRYNERYRAGREPIEVEDRLVEAVLDEVQTGRVSLGDAGLGAIAGPAAADTTARVETPFLQLVMTRLWEEEVEKRGSHVLRLKTLQEPPLGGARTIVQAHLARVMESLDRSEKVAAARAFQYLVTPSGGKIAYPVRDLAGDAGIEVASLLSVLEKLSRGDVRLLRQVGPAPGSPPGSRFERYEIFHDVLAPGVLAWRSRFMQEEYRAERQKKLRRVQAVAAVLGAAVIITVLATLSARAAHRAGFELALSAVEQSLEPVYRERGVDARYAPELEALRIDQLNRALPLYHALLERRPASRRANERLAFAHLTLGDIYRTLYQYGEAVLDYNEAIARFSALAARQPQNEQHRHRLARAYNALGETYRESGGDAIAAKAAYDRALELLRQLHQADPDNAEYRQDIAQTLNNRAVLQSRSVLAAADTSRAGAEADLRAAAAMLEPFAGADAPARTLQELGRIYNNLGALELDQDRPEAAHEWYTRAVQMHERLVTRQPAVREYRIELEKFYTNLADLSRELGEFDQAAAQSRQAIATIERLAQPAPLIWVDLADAHNVRGRIMEEAGLPGALQEYRRSLDVLRRLEDDPRAWGLPEYHERFDDLLTNLAEPVGPATQPERPRLLADARAAWLGLARTIAESGAPADAISLLQSMSRASPQLQAERQSSPAAEQVRQQLRARAALPPQRTGQDRDQPSDGPPREEP